MLHFCCNMSHFDYLVNILKNYTVYVDGTPNLQIDERCMLNLDSFTKSNET